jgi:lambda repressor-like predicted transcriptional regulator
MELKEFIDITGTTISHISRKTNLDKNTIKNILKGKKCLPQTSLVINLYMDKVLRDLQK